MSLRPQSSTPPARQPPGGEEIKRRDEIVLDDCARIARAADSSTCRKNKMLLWRGPIHNMIRNSVFDLEREEHGRAVGIQKSFQNDLKISAL